MSKSEIEFRDPGDRERLLPRIAELAQWFLDLQHEHEGHKTHWWNRKDRDND